MGWAVVVRARNLARRIVARLAMPTVRRDTDVVRLGSVYGGWWVRRSSVFAGSVAYCVGAGEDITFDIALHESGCVVRVFDPTPRAIAHVEATMPRSDRFTFRPVGLWSEDTEMRFYAPANSGFVSHSAVNLYGTAEYFTAPVRTLRSLMHEFGDTNLDLLKIDIEGAEIAVIESLLANGPLPIVLCVEFDQPQSIRRIIRTARRLTRAGYSLAKVDHWNYTFVRHY